MCEPARRWCCGFCVCSHQYLVASERGKTCDKTCEDESLSCEQSSADFGKINNCDALKQVCARPSLHFLPLASSPPPTLSSSLRSSFRFAPHQVASSVLPSAPILSSQFRLSNLSSASGSAGAMMPLFSLLPSPLLPPFHFPFLSFSLSMCVCPCLRLCCVVWICLCLHLRQSERE